MYEQIEVLSIHTAPDNHIILTIEIEKVRTIHTFQFASPPLFVYFSDSFGQISSIIPWAIKSIVRLMEQYHAGEPIALPVTLKYENREAD